MVHDWLGTTGNTKQAEVIRHSIQSILQATQSRPGSLHMATQSIHGAQMACSSEDSPLLLCTAWEVTFTQGDNTKYKINPHV